MRNFVHRAIEGVLIRVRRFRESGQLPNELKGRRADFIVCRRRCKIMQGLNVSAHKELLTADAVVSKVESITRMETDFPFSQLSTINCLSSRRVWFRARNLDRLRVDLFRPSPAFLARRAKGLLSETSIPKGAVRSGQRARSLRVREPAFYFAMQMFFGSVKNSAFAKPPSSRFGAKGYGATGSAPLVSEFILRYKHSWPR